MAATFHGFAATVLAQRAEDGIRGIDAERNRFAMHIRDSLLAPMALNEIRSRHVREWLREMARKDAQDSRGARKITTETIKRSFSLVSAILSAAVEREELEVNPCAGVRVKRRADESATRDKWTWLTLDEQRSVAACDEISTADRLTIRFAVATGLRQGEQFNLELADIHAWTDNPRVVVRYGSRGRKPPKSGKIRTVPLFADGLVAAREWLEVLPSHAPENPYRLVFPSRYGTQRGVGKPLGRGDAFKQALASAGITRRVRWHDLRHTFCSNLVSGVLGRRWTLEEIRPLAGHSSITVTERYAHIGETEILKAAGETTFAHGPLMPLAKATERDLPAANDTERDVFVWDEDEAVAS